jgi:hypothetical protein
MLLAFLYFAKMSWGIGETWIRRDMPRQFAARLASNSLYASTLEFPNPAAQNL